MYNRNYSGFEYASTTLGTGWNPPLRKASDLEQPKKNPKKKSRNLRDFFTV